MQYAKISRSRIKELHADGASAREISEALGCRADTIYKALANMGLKPNRPKRSTRKQMHLERVKGMTPKADQTDGYAVKELAVAIITRAVEDYKVRLRRPHAFGGQYALTEIERFFKSDWYQLLSTACENPVDGERIVAALREREEQRKVRAYEKNRARADREAQELARAAAGLQDNQGSDT